MAYLLKEEDENGVLPQQAQTPSVGAARATIGSAPVASMPAGAPAQGGRFVAFERYFNANRDAAQRTGDTMANRVQQQGQEAASGLRKAQGEFGNAVAKGAVSYNPGATKEQADQFSKLSYSGPGTLDDLNGFQRVANQAADAASAATNLADTQGRKGVLAQEFGSQSQGNAKFDSALTGAASGGRFQQLSSRYGRLNDALAKARADSQAYADAVRTASGQAAAQYGDDAARLKKDEEDAEIEAERQRQAGADRQKAMDAYQATLRREWNQLSYEDRARLGYGGNDGEARFYADKMAERFGG